jgi:GTP cyclohydrolase I
LGTSAAVPQGHARLAPSSIKLIGYRPMGVSLIEAVGRCQSHSACRSRWVALGFGSMSADGTQIEQAVRVLLEASGLDPASKDLAGTPRRVSELWQREFLSGYERDPAQILGSPVMGEPQSEAVFLFDLAFHSMCPHHLLPYQGRAHLVYLPSDKLVGFGRLAELVACYTRRLTLQERATRQIADAIMEHLGARGAGCILEARQLCLGIPNDQHAQNHVFSSAFVGELEQRDDLRSALLSGATARRTEF